MVKKVIGFGKKEREVVDAKIKEGWPINRIAKHLGVTHYKVSTYLAKKKFALPEDLPVRIRMELENTGYFGKLNETTQGFITELFREGIPPKIVAELLGLGYSPSMEHGEYGGFYEKKELFLRDKFKQGQAEHKVRLIMAATTEPKPNDALRFLAANESTRDLYKPPKEEKSAIEIRFPGFSRDIDVDGEAEEDEEAEKDKTKLN